MANKHMKICPASLIIREIQIKTIMRYHFTPGRMSITKKSITNMIESPEINPCTHTLSLTKEARIYNGGKTASIISNAGKTGQLHVTE